MPARTARCLKRRENGLLNLVLIKRNFASVAFANHINAHGRCLHHSLFYPYYFPFENKLITSRSFGISCGCFLLPMLHIVSAKQERKPSYTTGAALVNAESGRNGQPKTARSAASPVNRTASTDGENRAKILFFLFAERSPRYAADLSVLCVFSAGMRPDTAVKFGHSIILPAAAADPENPALTAAPTAPDSPQRPPPALSSESA